MEPFKLMTPPPQYVNAHAGDHLLLPVPHTLGLPNSSTQLIASRNQYGKEELPAARPKKYRSLSQDKDKTSVYRGVSKYKNRRFECFVWDNSLRRASGKGKTGRFDTAIEAARAHDLVSIKIWGKSAHTNFPVSSYQKEISKMQCMTIKQYIIAVRRNEDNVSSSLKKRTTNDPYGELPKYHHPLDQAMEQHVITPFSDYQNHIPAGEFSGAAIQMEKQDVTGATFQGSTIEQPVMLQGIYDKVPQLAPQVLQNIQQASVHDAVSPFDNQQFLYDQYQGTTGTPFQNHQSFIPYSSFEFGSTSDTVKDNMQTLGNTMMWSDNNPVGVENDVFGSFGLDSMGMVPNNQEFEQAPELQAVMPDQGYYEPNLQYNFETNNTGFQYENMVENGNELDGGHCVNNLNNHIEKVDDQEIPKLVDELWAKMEAGMCISSDMFGIEEMLSEEYCGFN
ncbi:hypothetical protein RJT34_23902 [Clitoria ternatea]|uniref:AP2/ERF domain-containing protein n=1 Tax=Clitoria ternatea TaxID=43366 RepID=A0AAN9FTH6_CLITE